MHLGIVPPLIRLSLLKVLGLPRLNTRIRRVQETVQARYFRSVTIVDPVFQTHVSQSGHSEDDLDALLTTCWILFWIFSRMRSALLMGGLQGVKLSHVVKRQWHTSMPASASSTSFVSLHKESGYATSDVRQRPGSHLSSERLSIQDGWARSRKSTASKQA